MSKYKPAIFQPTVRPSWAGMLSYISAEEKSQILEAIIKYPTAPKIESKFWEDTIRPDLEMQYEAFEETCRAKGRASKNYWESQKNKIDVQVPAQENLTNQTIIEETSVIGGMEEVNYNLNDDMLKKYPVDHYNYTNKLIEVQAHNPIVFCELDEYIEKYGKSCGEYFYWIASKGWVWRTSEKTQTKLKQVGYDINDAIRREHFARGTIEYNNRCKTNI